MCTFLIFSFLALSLTQQLLIIIKHLGKPETLGETINLPKNRLQLSHTGKDVKLHDSPFLRYMVRFSAILTKDTTLKISSLLSYTL